VRGQRRIHRHQLERLEKNGPVERFYSSFAALYDGLTPLTTKPFEVDT
jgi:hypothetical protein